MNTNNETDLIQVIQKHLTHLVHWNCGIYWTIQTEFANEVRQGANMKRVRKRQQQCINLMYVPAIISKCHYTN